MEELVEIDGPGGLQPGILTELAERLSPYDPADLLASVAALQLLPENADRTVRLEAFAHTIASLPDEPDKPHISLSRLRRFANEEPLGASVAAQEDPSDNAFTEAFPFDGGTYIVFPGIVDESTFVLRHIAEALFVHPEPFPNPDYIGKAYVLLLAVLALSNEIAHRAGLGRGIMPRFRGREAPVEVPDTQRLIPLKRAVSFQQAELEQLLAGRNLPLSALDQLSVSLGGIAVDEYQINTGELLVRPLVRAGDQLIVSIPGTLLVAARHWLIRLAFEHNVEGELARRYSSAVWRTVVQSLSYLGNLPLQLSAPGFPPPDIPCSRADLFTLDTDKLMYAMLVTDPLEDYQQQSAFGQWSLEKIKARVGEQFQVVKDYLSNMPSPPNEVLFLFLFQSVGRVVFWNYQGIDEITPSLRLGLTAADLQTIALLEAEEPLTLWKYARMSWKVREQTHIIAMGELNEFFAYRKHGYSYYVSDEPRPGLLAIQPGGAGELRQEVIVQRDWHTVRSFRSPYAVEVTTAHNTPSVPIYVPTRHIDQQASFLVEGLPLPIWIVEPLLEDDEHWGLYDGYGNFAHTLAYWLWQFIPALRSALQALSPTYDQVVFNLSFTTHKSVKENGEELSGDGEMVTLAVDSTSGILNLTLHPLIRKLLNSADNRGERHLMERVLHGLRELLPEQERGKLSDAVIMGILERYAPLGVKRMLLYFEVNAFPDLDPRGLPPFRKVQEADVNELLDELGDYLNSSEQLAPGEISEERRNGILNKAVMFYYQDLTRLVASLRPEGLLEFLVAHQEAITYKTTFHEFSLPSRLACFGSEPTIAAQLGRETPELATAAVANRFLIEYITASPPRGLRPISVSVYDRLLALAAHIIHFGFTSDLLHYRLAAIGLSMLPSGRLDVDREQYEKAYANYLPGLFTSEITHATQAFTERWQEKEQTTEEAELWNKLDRAATAEFGYSFTGLQTFMARAFELSEPMDMDRIVYRFRLDEFIDRMSGALGWSTEQVRSLLDALTLSPRIAFLKPPSPYRAEDTYPWRYNRSLSHVRRPFLLRKNDTEDEILWGNRHLYKTANFLVQLYLSGRAQVQSPEMRQLIGAILHQQGEEFNDQVADLLEQNTDLIVRRRVKEVGDIKVPGDIDVLVADPRRRRLGVIECKDFVVARTPHEMDTELKKFFQGNGKKSAVEKVEERAAWVHENIGQILDWLQLGNAGKIRLWKVRTFIIVSQELFTPYLKRSSIPVMSFEKLSRDPLQVLLG